ncbi:RNA polymerase-binding protein DksA [Acinetobacter shaoyimingii]|uniref:RNA polymerase-binding transcription factor DksA n=1 Tax=Acinetobacter shaoyimingii TaxID=2715164 RepID=A0A6G8RZ96_9GAMM|nr:RNA polymerase-binding protein DksA [Acinetobacter shaoyimingii]NHB59180.1 RNA polymerase-binding protein DksA [Acinetobacter shaoyimingii]QIO07118.1 RNA polymerase-binding protein DksA [Acinetobacter shaoyimingii]
MANDNQDQVLQDSNVLADDKVTKRVRKTKPKTAEGGTTASLFGIEPYQPKKNEEYMSEGQLEHFRKILLAWKEELMSEVDRTLNTMQDENTALPDVNDRATQEEEFAIELRTRDRERKLIRKIEQSLDAIKNDDYGFCETCGIEIGLRRLEARPTATLCIDCKTLAEIKEKQNNG